MIKVMVSYICELNLTLRVIKTSELVSGHAQMIGNFSAQKCHESDHRSATAPRGISPSKFLIIDV